MMDPILNFINGRFVPAEDGETLETVNPATGGTITTLPRSTSADVHIATKAAVDAGPMWSATTMDERIHWLERLADALEDDAETVASLETMDTGNPFRSSPPRPQPQNDGRRLRLK